MAAEAGASRTRSPLTATTSSARRSGCSAARGGSTRPTLSRLGEPVGGARAVDGRPALGRAAAVLRLPRRRGFPGRRSVGGAARARGSSGRCRGSSTNRRSSRMFEAAEDRAASGEPAARAQPCAARAALRLGPSRERAGQPAARRGAPGPAVPDRQRQGRARSGWCRSPRAREAAVRHGSTCAGGPLWLFPSGKRTSAGCGCSRSCARSPPMPAFRPTGSARTCCATPSRPICCRAAPTCACCSRCSAMPTSRPRRSTPMSIARGWSSWSTAAIRSRPRRR